LACIFSRAITNHNPAKLGRDGSGKYKWLVWSNFTAGRYSTKLTPPIELLRTTEVLDILVQKRCNAKAAKRFFQKLLKGLKHVPRVIVTHKLASFGAAHAEVLPQVTHLRGRCLNNRAQNSHQPTR
jgi:DDE domain